MQTSIIIISHNEEIHIAKCIESVLNQTKKPDEVILIVHNGTDKTFEIAQNYPIKTIKFYGESGPVYARIEGVKNASKDILLCIDGDSIAKNNWVEVMSETLQKNNNILVGSYVKMSCSIFEQISNIWNRYFCATKNDKAVPWIWGASFGFWSKDKDIVINTFNESIKVSKELKLMQGRIAEDYQLALHMIKLGNIEVTNKTHVTAHTKDETVLKSIKRNRINHQNGYKIKRFFEKNYVS